MKGHYPALRGASRWFELQSNTKAPMAADNSGSHRNYATGQVHSGLAGFVVLTNLKPHISQ